MTDKLLVRAMLAISKAPDDYDSVRAAVEEAMRQAVLRDRRRIVACVNRCRWGQGNAATHEIRHMARALVGSTK